MLSKENSFYRLHFIHLFARGQPVLFNLPENFSGLPLPGMYGPDYKGASVLENKCINLIHQLLIFQHMIKLSVTQVFVQKKISLNGYMQLIEWFASFIKYSLHLTKSSYRDVFAQVLSIDMIQSSQIYSENLVIIRSNTDSFF